MVGCSAPNCSNRAAKGGYKMKRFPADPAIRQIWINNVRRADWNWNPPANFRNCRVCEVHFDEEQFDNTSDGSYRRFKPGAIPTVFNVSPGPEEKSGIPSFGAYCSRRRKKIVGNYDPSLCAANMNPINQRLSSFHDSSPNNAGETSHSASTASAQDQLDRRNPKGNLPTSSLSVASYLTDHPYFSHSSSQIQYDYHKRFEDNRAPMSLAFHGRETDAIHLPNIPISTTERFNIFSSVGASSRTGGIPDTDLAVDNIQTMLEPGEIKLEYIADSPASENETSSWSSFDKTMPVKSLRIQKDPEENIQTAMMQEMPQTVIHEKFKNLPPTIQPMLSMAPRDQEQQSQPAPDLSQNIKVDYDFKMSASDFGLSRHYSESGTDRAQPSSKILVTSGSTLSATTTMSAASKKDLTILPNLAEANCHERIQRSIPMEKWQNSPSPSLQKDVARNTTSKHLPDVQISLESQFSAFTPKKPISLLPKRNLTLFRQQSEYEPSIEEQSDIQLLDPSSGSISYSMSSKIQETRKAIRPAVEKKERLTRAKNRLHSKRFLADRLQKKLNEERRISRKLRLENQKLKKQLGPLRSLRHWIAKFLGTDQVKQLESLEAKKTTFESLQKALKMCSLVCGYLSTVVNVPFYSTQTQPV